MRVIAVKVTKNADRMVREVALRVDQILVMETPVASGYARSNWIPALGIGSIEERPSFGPGGGSLQIAEMQQVVAQYSGDVKRAIHITNNVIYINRLNEGWSAQAPAGFVDAAVIKGIEAAAEVSILE